MLTTFLAIVGTLAAPLGLTDPDPAPESEARAGRLYPDLLLPTIEGDRWVRLSELRGKKVLLIEFASW